MDWYVKWSDLCFETVKKRKFYKMNLPITKLSAYPHGACTHTRPLVYTASAAPFMKPPPTQVAKEYQNIYIALLYL